MLSLEAYWILEKVFYRRIKAHIGHKIPPHTVTYRIQCSLYFISVKMSQTLLVAGCSINVCPEGLREDILITATDQCSCLVSRYDV